MFAEKVQGLLTGDEVDNDGVGARNFSIHLTSLSATKIADGLINPKLVLAWLLSALGAPGYLIGALVPVREAGALLPQMALAASIQRRVRRKWAWALGSSLQGLAALGIAASAFLLQGATAGWAILGCLAVLAVARAICSASFKDVLSRTVAKGARGTVSGTAGTVGAIVVLAFAAVLGTGLVPRETGWVAGAVGIAGVLWLLAATMFVRLDEPAAETAQAGARGEGLFVPLARDPELRRYLVTRGLMVSTALAPPFLVILSPAGQNGGFGNLGLMLIGSAAAAILSSYVWGRLSDRSSRRTLMLSAGLAAVVFAVAAVAALAAGSIGGAVGTMAFIFAAQIAYEGARAGRKTHLTDMESNGQKTIYTALSNTIIGAVLLIGGVFGLLAELLGPGWVLAIFSLMAACGAWTASRLQEVQS